MTSQRNCLLSSTEPLLLFHCILMLRIKMVKALNRKKKTLNELMIYYDLSRQFSIYASTVTIEYTIWFDDGAYNSKLIFDSVTKCRLLVYANCISPKQKNLRIMAQKKNFHIYVPEFTYLQSHTFIIFMINLHMNFVYLLHYR